MYWYKLGLTIFLHFVCLSGHMEFHVVSDRAVANCAKRGLNWCTVNRYLWYLALCLRNINRDEKILSIFWNFKKGRPTELLCQNICRETSSSMLPNSSMPATSLCTRNTLSTFECLLFADRCIDASGENGISYSLVFISTTEQCHPHNVIFTITTIYSYVSELNNSEEIFRLT